MKEINTILETRDGRRIGNAIVISNNGLSLNTVLTDYGSNMLLTDAEIDGLFYCRMQSEEEIEMMGRHKNAVSTQKGETNDKRKN